MVSIESNIKKGWLGTPTRGAHYIAIVLLIVIRVRGAVYAEQNNDKSVNAESTSIDSAVCTSSTRRRLGVFRGDGAYAVPTTKNYASELSTLGIIAGVNLTAVQWEGLALGEPPS